MNLPFDDVPNPDFKKQYEAVTARFQDLRGLIARVLKEDEDPEFNRFLTQLSDRFEETTKELDQAFPEALAELEKRETENQELHKELDQVIAERRQEFDDLQTKLAELATPATAPSEPKLDLMYAALLRSELMGLLRGESVAAPRLPEGEVQEMSSSAWQVAPQAAPKQGTPKQAQPPQKDKPRREGDDVWGMSSGEWRKE